MNILIDNFKKQSYQVSKYESKGSIEQKESDKNCVALTPH